MDALIDSQNEAVTVENYIKFISNEWTLAGCPVEVDAASLSWEKLCAILPTLAP